MKFAILTGIVYALFLGTFLMSWESASIYLIAGTTAFLSVFIYGYFTGFMFGEINAGIESSIAQSRSLEYVWARRIT